VTTSLNEDKKKLILQNVASKGKGKIDPITGREIPEAEYKYSSTFS
jgi:hypothetical protein